MNWKKKQVVGHVGRVSQERVEEECVGGGQWRGWAGQGSGESRSRSPLSPGEIAAGWSEDNTQPPTHPFTTNPGMTVPIPTTRLGFFQLFVPFELMFFFFMEGMNDYAHYQRVEMGKLCSSRWSGTSVIDIA